MDEEGQRVILMIMIVIIILMIMIHDNHHEFDGQDHHNCQKFILSIVTQCTALISFSSPMCNDV